MAELNSARPSMAVSKDNTKSLMSRFEQLTTIVQKTETLREKRGYTGPTKNTGWTPATKSPSANTTTKQTSSPSPVASKWSAVSPQSGKTQPVATSSPNTRGNTISSPNSNPVNNGNANNTSNNLAASQNNNNSNGWKQTAPATTSKPINTPTVTIAAPTSAPDDDTPRTKPLQKPKPDMNRASQYVAKPVGASKAATTAAANMHANNNVETTKPTPQPTPVNNNNTAPPLSMSQNPSIVNSILDIPDKWKINYDELEFSDLVSSGSAGEVYMGYYFGTAVAIKKLFALANDQKHLVAREFAMLTGVNHPNIVQFLGICDHSSGVYLITEYVEHGDLFDLLIFGDRKLKIKEKVKIAFQVAQAVYYLHSRNIIHRDLKSQNVLIGDNFKVKLCDLGLATVLENKKRMTVCGTNEWMAPEITIAETYDNKVDVFSFGIVLTEMITNQPPRKRPIEKGMAFQEDEFLESVPEDCPQELSSLVLDCCKFDPQERPGFKDIVNRLKTILNSLED